MERIKKRAAIEDEDTETLAAIDGGLRDAKAGRVVSEQKVRELLREWTSGQTENEQKRHRPAG